MPSNIYPARTPQSKSANYRPDIDGLRALALIAVVINHFDKRVLPSGYLGVDIFFVISGFVITSSLLYKPQQSFRKGILNFYARRMKRLVPALALCVIITSALTCLFDPSPGSSLQTGLSALVGASNLYLFSQSTDYFAPSTELNTFTQTWSLGVEEQFYLLFPLLLGISGFWRNNAPANLHNQRRLGWIIFILSGLSLSGFLAFHASQTAAVYFLMPFRFWELGFGCILAITNLNLSQKFQHIRRLYGPLSLLLIAALVATFFAPEQLAKQVTVLAVIFTCMLIAFPATRSFVHKLLTHQISLWIGMISYSLYLWHWSILSLSHWTIGIHAWTVPFQVVAMVGMASISYYGIEKPLRFASWHPSQLMTILIGLLISAAGGLIIILLGKPLEGKLFLGDGGKAAADARIASSLVNNQGILSKDVEAKLKQCNLTPFLLGKNSHRLKEPVDSAFIKNCLIGDANNTNRIKRLLLVGDSFAEKLAPHIALAAEKLGYQFGMIYGYGCPYLLDSTKIKGASFPECRYLNEQLLEHAVLESLGPGDILILRLHLVSRSYVRYPTLTSRPEADVYDAALKDIAAKVAQRGAKLIVLGPNPVLGKREMMALKPEWFNSLNRMDAIPPKNSQETSYFHQLDENLSAKSKHWNAGTYVSLKPYICRPDQFCLLEKDGRFLYSDDHHLSPYGHDLLFPVLMNLAKHLP